MKLDTRAAAAHLGLKPKTLENWRWSGSGPAFYRLGYRVIYDIEDLEAWLAARRRTRTSDPCARPAG